MRKLYTAPVMEVDYFSAGDIVTASEVKITITLPDTSNKRETPPISFEFLN